jgi:hypothetical protein
MKNLDYSNKRGENYFGNAIAADATSKLIVVGAYCDHNDANYSGAVYIFGRDTDTEHNFGQLARLKSPSPVLNQMFGSDVDIDNTTVIIGAKGRMNYGKGSAYIYEKSTSDDGTWNMIKQIVPSDRYDKDYFGSSVLIKGDYAFVGAKANLPSQCAVYVFKKNHEGVNNWGQIAKITVPAGENAKSFGDNLAFDNDVLVIGAPYQDNVNGGAEDDRGAIFIYSKTGDTFNHVKTIKSRNGMAFGSSLALDNDLLVVGAEDDGVSGKVHLYKRNSGGTNNWGHLKQLVPRYEGSIHGFGSSVDIRNNTIYVGGSDYDTYRGEIYLFEKDNGGTDNWGRLYYTSGYSGPTGIREYEKLGASVVAYDDVYFLGGAPHKAGEFGDVYLFRKNCPKPEGVTQKSLGAGKVEVKIGNHTSRISKYSYYWYDKSFKKHQGNFTGASSVLTGFPVGQKVNMTVKSVCETGNESGSTGVGVTATEPKTIKLEGNMSFGNIDINGTKKQTLIIKSIGLESISVTDITLPEGFSVTEKSFTINAGASKNVDVTYNPTENKSYNGTIKVISDAAAGATTIDVTAGVKVKTIELKGDLNFGTVKLNASVTKKITVKNAGTGTINITNVDCPDGVTAASTNFSLGEGNIRELTFTFTPTEAKNYSGTVTFQGDHTSGKSTVDFTGVGQAKSTLQITSVTPQERSCTLVFKHSEKKGTVYFVITKRGVTEPTSAQIKAGKGGDDKPAVQSQNTTINSNTAMYNVSGLKEFTDYNVYAFVELNGISSDVVGKGFKTTDEKNPSFVMSSNTISDSHINKRNVNIGARVSEDATVNFVVQLASETAPNITQIQAGQNHAGTVLDENLTGEKLLTSGSWHNIDVVKNLDEVTDYAVYMVAQDKSGKKSDIYKATFSIGDYTAPVLSALNVTTVKNSEGYTEATFSFNSTENGKMAFVFEQVFNKPSYTNPVPDVVAHGRIASSADIGVSMLNSIAVNSGNNSFNRIIEGGVEYKFHVIVDDVSKNRSVTYSSDFFISAKDEKISALKLISMEASRDRAVDFKFASMEDTGDMRLKVVDAGSAEPTREELRKYDARKRRVLRNMDIRRLDFLNAPNRSYDLYWLYTDMSGNESFMCINLKTQPSAGKPLPAPEAFGNYTKAMSGNDVNITFNSGTAGKVYYIATEEEQIGISSLQIRLGKSAEHEVASLKGSYDLSRGVMNITGLESGKKYHIYMVRESSDGFLSEIEHTMNVKQETNISLSSIKSFGNVITGQSKKQTLTVSCTGNSSLIITNITLPGGYSISETDFVVKQGETKDITLTFAPTEIKNYSGTLSIVCNSTGGNSTLSLSGAGISANGKNISLTGNMNFGKINVGGSESKELTISNSGNSDLSITDITVPEGFVVSETNMTIAAGESEVVNVIFTPKEAKSYNGKVTVVSDKTSGNNTIDLVAQGVVANSVKVSVDAKIDIYPNPVVDILTVSTSADCKSIKIYNSTGNLLIHSSNTNVIDVGDLSSGVYVIVIELEEGTCSRVVVKSSN